MESKLGKFLRRFANLSDNELHDITSRFKSRVVKKNTYLLRQGEVSKDFIFVVKGCLRLYYVQDGIEVSVWFAFPESSAIEVHSFVSGKPSEYFLQAIEDSEVLLLSQAGLKNLYDSQTKMQELMRNFWEAVLLDLIDRFTALQRDSAEKRYLDLLNKPEYMERVPQKYLASFLGITPTSLSRIRKLVRKDH